LHPHTLVNDFDGLATGTSNTCQPALAEFNFSIMAFLSLPNCAPEVFVHARRHVFVVLIRDVFAYHLRVQEAVTANAAMPLVAGEDVRTPRELYACLIVFHHGNGDRPSRKQMSPDGTEASAYSLIEMLPFRS
jgi:hypothetical protein